MTKKTLNFIFELQSLWHGRPEMSKKYEVLFHHNTHYAVVSKIQILVPSLKRFLLRSLHR